MNIEEKKRSLKGRGAERRKEDIQTRKTDEINNKQQIPVNSSKQRHTHRQKIQLFVIHNNIK